MERKRISLNELPNFSPWPERLLGITPWSVEKRTIEKITREYDAEKYFACLQKYESSGGSISMEEMKHFELGSGDQAVCASVGEDLYVGPQQEFLEEYYAYIYRTLAPHVQQSSAVLELGAGYGYNLAMLKAQHPTEDIAWVGGEYSQNGITIARHLAKGIRMEHFDFYSTPYEFLEQVGGKVTVFTVFGAHQLPSAESFIEGLRPYKERIHRVVNLESVYEFCGATLLGLMRKRYIEMCDYNTDLYTLLQSAPDIDIIAKESNVMGLNPLLPVSRVEWKFR